MSDDLVDRLRTVRRSFPQIEQLLTNAADRIAALEEALRWINGMPLTGIEPDHPARVMQVIATRALEGKPHD